MTRVAVIEDDQPTSNQLRGWIVAARPGIVVDQWFTRDDAEVALACERYDLVVLDIELGRERNAGVAHHQRHQQNAHAGTPVLVVSAMPAAIYRSIMKALGRLGLPAEKPPSTSPISSRLSSTSCAPPARPATRPVPCRLHQPPRWRRRWHSTRCARVPCSGAASASTCR